MHPEDEAVATADETADAPVPDDGTPPEDTGPDDAGVELGDSTGATAESDSGPVSEDQEARDERGYYCEVHDRPMTPNPRGSRYRWDCGGGSSGTCQPASA